MPRDRMVPVLSAYEQQVIAARRRRLFLSVRGGAVGSPRAKTSAASSVGGSKNWSSTPAAPLSSRCRVAPPGNNPTGVVVGLDHQLVRALPGWVQPGSAAGRPEQGHGFARRGRMPADHRCDRLRRRDGCPGRVGCALGRRTHRVRFGHRESRLDRRGAAPDRRVHGARRGDQRPRGRTLRRRAIVLELRGDHADALPGYVDHDAPRLHGADRQARARGVGFGRSGDQRRRSAASGSCPATGRRNTRRPISRAPTSCCCATTSTRMSPPASARRASSRPPIRSRAMSRLAAYTGARRLRDGGRSLLGKHQPRPQEAVRDPRGDDRGARPGCSAARALEGVWPAARRPW